MSSIENPEMKLAFLNAAISDAQGIIRFIETKGAIAIVVLSGMFSILFSDLRNICDNYYYYNIGVKIMVWLTVVFLMFSVCSIVILIMPIKKTYCEEIVPRFYLKTKCSKMDWIFPMYNDILLPITEYRQQIKEVGEDKIIDSLVCELYSVSYIREVKSKRLKKVLVIMLVSTFIFTITHILVLY